MNQRNAFITGGTGGIGQEIIYNLAASGMNLIIQYHKGENELMTMINKLKKFKISIFPIKIDLRNSNDVEKKLLLIPKDMQKIDILIHSAGIPIEYKSISNESIMNDFNEQYLVTIMNFIRIIQFSIPNMKINNWGRIICISSALAKNVPTNKLSPYITVKNALVGLSKSLAVELAPYKITVNSISPGITDTNFLSTFPRQMKEVVISKIPLKRIGIPQDIAKAVQFLCSPDAGYITGIDLIIAGGMVM